MAPPLEEGGGHVHAAEDVFRRMHVCQVAEVARASQQRQRTVQRGLILCLFQSSAQPVTDLVETLKVSHLADLK